MKAKSGKGKDTQNPPFIGLRVSGNKFGDFIVHQQLHQYKRAVWNIEHGVNRALYVWTGPIKYPHGREEVIKI